MKTGNLLGRLFNRQTGELEVVTVRTPEGRYDHHSSILGNVQFSMAEIEELERKNISQYELDMMELRNSTHLSVENVRSFVVQDNQAGRKVVTYATYCIKEAEQNRSFVPDTGAW